MFRKLKKSYLKKTPFKRKKKVIDQESIEKMRAFFLQIWGKRPHYCNVCGKGLGNEPHTYNFHHIISKQRQKNYSIDITYDDRNIIIMCFDCHSVVESGIESPLLKLAKENLLDEYEDYRVP